MGGETMKRLAALAVAGLLAAQAYGQAGRIYTSPEPAAAGGLTGKVDAELTHAMAVEHDRTRVYLAELTDGGRTFRFEHLPVGKYDLVLVTRNGGLDEGLALGGTADTLEATSLTNLKTRIGLADSFFNMTMIHRFGVDDGIVLALVERISNKHILKQSGDSLDQNLRRIEIIELHQAQDDWQMVGSRHLYREGEPVVESPVFSRHTFIPGLGNLRVVDSVKDLGSISLPP